MNKRKIIYWTSTIIFSIALLTIGIMYLFNPQVDQNINQLGFPDYFRIELGIAKIIGAIGLVIPFKGRINEWIYAGFTINLLSASLAHIATGDPISRTLIPLIFFGLLMISYFTGHKMNKI